MTLVSSEIGLGTLRGFVDDATLVAFDLDGTLAPLVDSPSRARIPDRVREGLVRLSRHAPVAIITGRACRDARARLGFSPLYLVGNHGAEGLPGYEAREAGFVRLCRGWDRQLRRLLPAAGHPGILRENKGASLSIHYRLAPDPASARRGILEAIGNLQPPARRVPGHFVENVLPPDAPGKGVALRALMGHSGCRRALFVGDDETDEDVFRLEDSRILGIRVGLGAPSDACLRLRDQGEIGLLVDLLAEIRKPGARDRES